MVSISAGARNNFIAIGSGKVYHMGVASGWAQGFRSPIEMFFQIFRLNFS